jgi:hypothetical protein
MNNTMSPSVDEVPESAEAILLLQETASDEPDMHAIPLSWISIKSD